MDASHRLAARDVAVVLLVLAVAKVSAGLLVFRSSDSGLEVLLAHPGGPFWAKKDDGAWTIPKGELSEGEDPLAAARREFEEEMGQAIDGAFMPLGEVRQAGGKRVIAWAVRGHFDPDSLRSNLFTVEWPPKSGRRQEFPEVDRVAWFDLDSARRKILPGQLPLIDRLTEAGDADAGTLNRDSQG